MVSLPVSPFSRPFLRPSNIIPTHLMGVVMFLSKYIVDDDDTENQIQKPENKNMFYARLGSHKHSIHSIISE